MKMMVTIALAATLAGLASAPAAAKEYVVAMKTQGTTGMMVFEPAFTKVAPGDTVRFKAVDPTHNAETMANMLPAGVASSMGAMNKDFVLQTTAPGIYGIKCKPHFAMGMIAVVQVGNGPSSNLAAARMVKLPGLAAKRMAPLLAKAK